MYKLESVQENKINKIFCEFYMQTNHIFSVKEHESNRDTNYYWYVQNGPQRLVKWTRRVGKWKTSRNYSIIDIGQNSERSSGDARRLAVT